MSPVTSPFGWTVPPMAADNDMTSLTDPSPDLEGRGKFALYVTVGILALVLGWMLVFKCVKRLRHKAMGGNELLLHVATPRGCARVLLWSGNFCPGVLRFHADRVPTEARVRGLLCPTFTYNCDPPVIRNSVMRIHERLSTSVSLGFLEALRMRVLMASGVLHMHFEWRHKGQSTLASTQEERMLPTLTSGVGLPSSI